MSLRQEVQRLHLVHAVLVVDEEELRLLGEDLRLLVLGPHKMNICHDGQGNALARLVLLLPEDITGLLGKKHCIIQLVICEIDQGKRKHSNRLLLFVAHVLDDFPRFLSTCCCLFSIGPAHVCRRCLGQKRRQEEFVLRCGFRKPSRNRDSLTERIIRILKLLFSHLHFSHEA